MKPELWHKVEELFHATLECAPEARQGFLEANCSGSIDLRRQVEVLLAQDEKARSFLEVPAGEDTILPLTAAGSLVGQQLGPYQILSPLGAGGMGEVYRAHEGKLGRDVAIKTLPHEFAGDPQRLSRLRREACKNGKVNHDADHPFLRDTSLPMWHGWHGFRRGLATNLNRLGVQGKTIQAILRHATLSVTQNLYIKTVNADSVTAMQSLELSVESVLCAKRAPGTAISPSRTVN
jgi:hypothetical protein